MTLTTRFRLMTVASFGAYLAIGGGMVLGMRTMAQISRQHAISDRMNYLIGARATARDEFLKKGDVRSRGQWAATQRQLTDIVEEARGALPGRRKQKILSNMAANLDISGQIFRLLEERDASPDAMATGQERVLVAQLIQLSRSLVVEWNRLGRELRDGAAEFERRLALSTGLAVLLLIALTGFNSAIIRRRVVERVQEIKRGARLVAEGVLGDDIPERNRDELGELARAFNDMKRGIRASREFLEQANERLERKVRERTALLEEKTGALEVSNRDLRQFAYIASHDLQEPLRVMVNYLQLLERTGRGRLTEEHMKFIDVATQQAFRMRSLIQDVLEFSSIEALRRTYGPVDCGAALRYAVANLQQTIDETGAVIDAGPLPSVTGDEPLMIQLFQNLLANAIKYRSGRRPEIRVRAFQDAGGWVFSVTDNGIGIDAAYREKIFGMFQRLHTKAEYSGTGIGLAICKKIVEKHGGTIWVESEVGQGSTFFFRIAGAAVPSVDGPRAAAPAPESSALAS